MQFTLIVAMALCLAPVERVLAQTTGEDEPFTLQFHSFVPAQPKTQLPAIGDILPWRSDMRRGQIAYDNGDYGTARQHFETALDKGNALAGWWLGNIYRLGLSVRRNERMAFKYYRELAVTYDAEDPRRKRQQFVIDSLIRVADVYRDGSRQAGIRPDPRRAYGIYNIAVEHKHPAAEYGLGVMFVRGLGVKRNINRGAGWLMQACKRRFASAQALMGELRWTGAYGKQSRIDGLKWYLLAQQTAQPHRQPEILDRLDQMLTEVSDAERLEAEKRAAAWAKRFPIPRPLLPVRH